MTWGCGTFGAWIQLNLDFMNKMAMGLGPAGAAMGPMGPGIQLGPSGPGMPAMGPMGQGPMPGYGAMPNGVMNPAMAPVGMGARYSQNNTPYMPVANPKTGV